MKHSTNGHNLFRIVIVALLLAFTIPATAFAQERGQGRHRADNVRWNKYNKKCGKFVNCHDARDGRVDGRGPRGDRVGYTVLQNRRNRIQDRRVGRRYWLQRRAVRRNYQREN